MNWTSRRAMLLLVGCNLLWAGSYVAGKAALRSLSPVELNCVRFGIAGITFLPFVWQSRRVVSLDRGNVLRLAGLCLLGFVLNKGAEFSGLRLTTASDTAILIAGEGIFTAVFGWILLGEVARGRSMMGLAIALLGTYLVVERGLVVPRLGSGTRILGDLLVIAGLVFESLYSVLGKSQLARYPGVVITGACVIGSLAVWIPAATLNVAVSGIPQLSVESWLGTLYLAVAGTTLAYLGWITALRHVDAAVAAPTLFLQPLVGTILAVLILGERLTWATIVGGVLIVLGIWVVSGVRPRNERVPGPVARGP